MQELVCLLAENTGTGVLPAPECFGIPGAGGMRGLEFAGASAAPPHLCAGEVFSVCLKPLNVSCCRVY